MPSPSEEDRARSYSTPPKKRRRYSVWTLLAPAAVVVLWISFFSALGQSCAFKECTDSGSASAKSDDADKPANDIAAGKRTKVKDGDTLGDIAERFGLTVAELQACNPAVDPQSLRAGTFLKVSAADCQGADKAEAGADPDPFAAESSATAPDPTKNGTAAADPSVDAVQDAGEEG
jgi:LysM repeat protein